MTSEMVRRLYLTKSVEQFRSLLKKHGHFSIAEDAPAFLKEAVDVMELNGEIGLDFTENNGTRHFKAIAK